MLLFTIKVTRQVKIILPVEIQVLPGRRMSVQSIDELQGKLTVPSPIKLLTSHTMTKEAVESGKKVVNMFTFISIDLQTFYNINAKIQLLKLSPDKTSYEDNIQQH